MAHPMSYSILSVKSTFPTKESALKMVKELIHEKVIADGSVYPVTTIRGDNSSTLVEEYMLEVRAPRKSFEVAVKYIEEHHPSTNPMVLTNVGYSNEKYFTWAYQSAGYVRQYPTYISAFVVIATIIGVIVSLMVLRKIL